MKMKLILWRTGLFLLSIIGSMIFITAGFVMGLITKRPLFSYLGLLIGVIIYELFWVIKFKGRVEDTL